MTYSNPDAKHYIGVDVSKETIDIYDDQTGKHRVIKNDKAAIRRFLKTIKTNAKIIFEATGGYERKLASLLDDFDNLERIRVHPACVKAFARAMGTKAKTDKIDAMMLAKAVKTMPESYVDTTPSPEVQSLRDQQTHLKHLEKIRHGEECRLKMDDLCDFVKKSIKRSIDHLNKEVERIQAEILKTIRSHEALNSKYERLQKVCGVGPVVAVSVLAFLPELGEVNRKEIASLAGLAPNTRQSGKSVGRAYTYGGRRLLRRALFMAALVSVKHNKILKEFYERLIENGRPKMVALIAVARKLLVHINANEKRFIKMQAGLA